MGSALYKSLDDLKSVIEDKWNTGSVDAGYPPRVVKVWEEKTLGFGNSRNPTILLNLTKTLLVYPPGYFLGTNDSPLILNTELVYCR